MMPAGLPKLPKLAMPRPYKKKAITGHGLLMKNKISAFLKSGMLRATPKGVKKGMTPNS